ncbi:MAG: phosphate ABC transporter ATP-binding protein, partial [Acidimicrobiales bacterium]|nr:phosphate ABC transporter ATP-binding protein [Acidimicrobiales bacterium]
MTSTDVPAKGVTVSSTDQTQMPEAASAEDVVFQTTDLSVFYGDFRAVRDVNLDIRQGEITALIGPSGCG